MVPSIISSILRIGIPSGIENSMFMMGKLLVSRIATDFGTAAIAANAVTSVINSYITTPVSALNIGLLTIAGQCIGAREYDSVRYFVRRIFILMEILLVLINTGTILFLNPVLGIFNLSPAAHAYARYFNIILCVMSPVAWIISWALPNVLRAAGDVRYVMIVAVLSMWIVRISGAYFYVYALKIGPAGMWYAMVTDWCVRGVFFSHRWFGGKWRQKGIIKDA
jgi:Na+-driven multidrug efflux pump